jgi:hypothetical protein
MAATAVARRVRAGTSRSSPLPSSGKRTSARSCTDTTTGTPRVRGAVYAVAWKRSAPATTLSSASRRGAGLGTPITNG